MDKGGAWAINQLFKQIAILNTHTRFYRWWSFDCPSEYQYLWDSCCWWISFTCFRSRADKPVIAPAIVYANLLLCHFIKQEELAVSCGCKWIWNITFVKWNPKQKDNCGVCCVGMGDCFYLGLCFWKTAHNSEGW